MNEPILTVAVSGASGMIGRAVGRAPRRTRTPGASPRPPEPGVGEVAWDPASGSIDTASLGVIDAAINLSGAGIGDHRWTARYKRTLVDSRIRSTKLLAATMAKMRPRPRVLLSASAVGYYGDRGDEVLDETASPGDGFLSELCQRWEAATAPAAEGGIDVAWMRTGVVLTSRDGALARQLPLFKLGLGSRFGSGRQWISWITLADHVAATTHLLTAGITGPVNLVAPHPVSNDEFTAELAHAVHRGACPSGSPGRFPGSPSAVNSPTTCCGSASAPSQRCSSSRGSALLCPTCRRRCAPCSNRLIHRNPRRSTSPLDVVHPIGWFRPNNRPSIRSDDPVAARPLIRRGV